MSFVKDRLTKWDLTQFYRSFADKQIEVDIKKHETLYENFAKKYKRVNFTTSADKLQKAISDYEILIAKMDGWRPLLYFYYLHALDTTNTKYQAKISLISNRLTKAENKITFFPLTLGKIAPNKQADLLKSEKLKRYRYYLKQRFLSAKYDLSELEEKIMNLKSLPSQTLWTQGLQKVLNKKTVKHNGKIIPLSEASNLYPKLPTRDRRVLYKKVMQENYAVSDFAESEINAIINDHKINDELRRRKSPYTERILSSENDEKTVLALINVTTKGFKIAHRFYKIKAKLLKLNKLEYADRSAQIHGFNTKYSYIDTIKLTNEIIGKYDNKLKTICEKISGGGQIDFFPKRGKTPGAFCSSSYNNPTLILLNHVNDFNSVTTYSHEIGHAIHSELAKTQPLLYQGYSLSTAETASTFFEGLVFDELIKGLSSDQQTIALHNKIQNQVNSVFRQIACFNFELELHRKIKEKGALIKEEIAKIMNKHMQVYLGPIFNLTNLDGYFFVGWSHIRSFFYVYTYAYGQLISNVLLAMVKEDPANIEKTINFMEAGGSDTPENIFRSVGINLKNQDFWSKGLSQIEKDVFKLENLMDKAH